MEKTSIVKSLNMLAQLIGEGDAGKLFLFYQACVADGDEEVAEYATPYSSQQAAKNLARAGNWFCIERKADNLPIGVVGFESKHGGRFKVQGMLCLFRPSCSHDEEVESLSMMIQYAFETLGCRAIQVDCDWSDEADSSLLNFGFTREKGYEMYYSLDIDDWRKIDAKDSRNA